MNRIYSREAANRMWFGLFVEFNTTFNNISVILWQSVLLVEETGGPRENHRPVASHWQTLSHNVVLSTPRHKRGSNSQLYWWRALIAQVVVNPTSIRSRPWWPRLCIWFILHKQMDGQRNYSPLQGFYFHTLYFPLYNSTCMRSVVNLQVFKSRKTFSTKCTSVRFLISVCSDVYQHLVSEI